MRLIKTSIVVMVVAFLAVSCAQETEPTVELTDGFIYTSFADASAAASTSGKSVVLDFYTDS